MQKLNIIKSTDERCHYPVLILKQATRPSQATDH